MIKSNKLLKMSNIKIINVVAAVIVEGDRVFAAQRGYGDRKDYWEFPGGKIEHRETPEAALHREILDSFVIYRGGGEDINKAAYFLLWTLSQEMAEWFMKRHELTNPAPQHLYWGIISADRVIAYINDREEFEIVQYRGKRG